MRRFLTPTFALLCASLLVPSALGQAGMVRESLTMQSRVMGEEVRYTIYLPPGYDRSARRYPVVYLLHGYTDDDTGWLQFGEVDRLADAGIASGEIPPMIIVMPDGGVSWYIDDHAGEVPWATMFVDEFVPHIEATYRVRAEKQFRALAGLSMGGHGCLVLALRNPDLFAACAALSAAVWTEDDFAGMGQEGYDRTFAALFGEGLEGRARLTGHWRAHSAIALVEDAEAEQLERVRYWIDCGDDDFLTTGNASLHIALTRKEIPHEYRVRDGAHTWSYWRTGLPDALAFVGHSFRR